MLRTVLGGRVERMTRPSMVVLVDDHVLSHAETTGADPALRTLTSHGVPVILVSRHPREHARAQQSRLGLVAPLISGGGAELSVPCGFLTAMHDAPDTDSGWNVIKFEGRSDRDPERAIQLLLGICWHHRGDGIVVGVSDRTTAILAQADVAILVRNPAIRQDALRQQIPDAYFTTAPGAAGWLEGILGAS